MNRLFLIFSLVGLSFHGYSSPDWSSPDTTWQVSPIAGYRSETFDSGYEIEQSEFGISGAIKDIPLYGDNPGLYMHLRAGYASGSVSQKTALSEIESNYSRKYIASGLKLLTGPIMNKLELGIGFKDYSEDVYSDIESNWILYGIARTLTESLSIHLDYRRTTILIGEFTDYVENDVWPYLQFAWAKLQVAAGPGFTFSNETNAKDVRARLNFDIFNFLYANVNFKYVYESNEYAGANANLLLPDQSLYSQARLSLPEDSYRVQTFIGKDRLLGMFGLGWRYQYQLTNMNDQANREVKRDQGYLITLTL